MSVLQGTRTPSLPKHMSYLTTCIFRRRISCYGHSNSALLVELFNRVGKYVRMCDISKNEYRYFDTIFEKYIDIDIDISIFHYIDKMSAKSRKYKFIAPFSV